MNAYLGIYVDVTKETFLVKSNRVCHTASRHLANQNVWPTTKNVSKMSLIAENKEEARSIWGIIKIYVHAVAMQ